MNKRVNTRSQVWPDTIATIKVPEAFGNRIEVKGVVANLGSNGMFIITDEVVAVPANADIVIDFEPEATLPSLAIRASGQTVHSTKKGIGIRFTNIDLKKLQKCIIAKMNRLEGNKDRLVADS